MALIQPTEQKITLELLLYLVLYRKVQADDPLPAVDGSGSCNRAVAAVQQYYVGKIAAEKRNLMNSQLI